MSTLTDVTTVIASIAAAGTVINAAWSWRKNLAEQRWRDEYNRKQADLHADCHRTRFFRRRPI
jgi:hypothetical protein